MTDQEQVLSPEELLRHYEQRCEELQYLQKERELVIQNALAKVQDELKVLDQSILTVNLVVASAKLEVEKAVLSVGQTIKGNKYQAIWVKGRETWDGKKLEGFAMAHPEILQAKKVGEPTVSFREIK